MILTDKGKSKLIVIIVLVALGLACVAGVAVFIKRPHAKQQKTAVVAQAPAMLLPLGELIVNLGDAGEIRYAKADIAMGFANSVSEEKKDDMKIQMRDVVIQVLGSKHFDDLIKPKGKQALKQQLMDAANKRLAGGSENKSENKIVEIYFNEFAMQ